MKIGIGIGYSGDRMALPLQAIQRAEQLGFDSVWTAESYGSDAITPLAYIGALTKKIRLGIILGSKNRSWPICSNIRE